MNASTHAEQAGRRADNSEWMDHAVRVGLVSYGVVHLVLAWLTLQLVFGGGGGSASNQGALQELAQNNLGLFFLYVAGVGFLALVVWQALEAIWGHRDEDGGKRVLKRRHLRRQGGALRQPRATALQDRHRVLVERRRHRRHHRAADGAARRDRSSSALVGVGILVVAGFLVYRGWKEKFRSKLEVEGKTGKDGRAYVLLGKIGYIAKGVALAVVGVAVPLRRVHATTRRSPAASTRRCTRCSSSRSAARPRRDRDRLRVLRRLLLRLGATP